MSSYGYMMLPEAFDSYINSKNVFDFSKVYGMERR